MYGFLQRIYSAENYSKITPRMNAENESICSRYS